MKIEWFKEFIMLYLKNEIDKAYIHKYNHLPQKLYKYQPCEDDRISAIINNKLWFSVPKEMNDPFDSRGVCWDSKSIEKLLKAEIPNKNIKKFNSTNDIVENLLNSQRDNIKITCFSERLDSMPMWAHYAGNHTGFCVEYNFTKLGWEHDFTKYLFPVWYESNKYDITNLLSRTFEMINNKYFDRRIYLIYFLMHIKHKSWMYEDEWRLINHRINEEDFKSGLENNPILPTAIYLGINFDKKKISKFKNINVPIYKLETSNTECFSLEKKVINI